MNYPKARKINIFPKHKFLSSDNRRVLVEEFDTLLKVELCKGNLKIEARHKSYLSSYIENLRAWANSWSCTNTAVPLEWQCPPMYFWIPCEGVSGEYKGIGAIRWIITTGEHRYSMRAEGLFKEDLK